MMYSGTVSMVQHATHLQCSGWTWGGKPKNNNMYFSTRGYDWRCGHINPLNAELNPICHLLALLGAHPIFHISRIRVKVDHTRPDQTSNRLQCQWLSCVSHVQKQKMECDAMLSFIASHKSRWIRNKTRSGTVHYNESLCSCLLLLLLLLLLYYCSQKFTRL